MKKAKKALRAATTRTATIQAAFVAEASGPGSAQSFRDIAGSVLSAYTFLMQKALKPDAQGKQGTDLSLTFRARTLLHARDVLIALANDAERYATWTIVRQATKRSRPQAPLGRRQRRPLDEKKEE